MRSRLLERHGAGRRRVTFHARSRDGQAAVGFMAARSHDLIVIDACPVLVPQLAAAPRIAHLLASQFIAADPAFDLQLTATATGLDCDVRGLRKADRWPGERLARLLDRLAVVRLSINGEPSVATARPMVQCGRAMVPLPPGGFLQATAAAEQILADEALERDAPGAQRRRPFLRRRAIRLAARRAPARDGDRLRCQGPGGARFRRPSHRRSEARRAPRDGICSASRSPPGNWRLRCGDLRSPSSRSRRAGPAIGQSPVHRIVAVSCDAATFARDAATLIAGGYRLSRITALDQFKWSSHIEIVATFARV